MLVRLLAILLLTASAFGADIDIGYTGSLASNVTLSEANSYRQIVASDQYTASTGDFIDTAVMVFRYAEDSAKVYLYWNDGGTWTLEDSSGFMISGGNYDTVMNEVSWTLTGGVSYCLVVSNLNGAGGTIPVRGATYLNPGPTAGTYSQASSSPPATFTGTTEVYYRLGVWATGESSPSNSQVIMIQ